MIPLQAGAHRDRPCHRQAVIGGARNPRRNRGVAHGQRHTWRTMLHRATPVVSSSVRSRWHTQSPSLLALLGDPGPAGPSGHRPLRRGLGGSTPGGCLGLDEVVWGALEDVAQGGQGGE